MAFKVITDYFDAAKWAITPIRVVPRKLTQLSSLVNMAGDEGFICLSQLNKEENTYEALFFNACEKV